MGYAEGKVFTNWRQKMVLLRIQIHIFDFHFIKTLSYEAF